MTVVCSPGTVKPSLVRTFIVTNQRPEASAGRTVNDGVPVSDAVKSPPQSLVYLSTAALGGLPHSVWIFRTSTPDPFTLMNWKPYGLPSPFFGATSNPVALPFNRSSAVPAWCTPDAW